jgi:hypothetical protein
VLHATTKKYLFPLILGSLVATTGLVLVLVFVDPFTSGWKGHFFLYCTLFLATTGITTTLTLLFRQNFFPGIYAELFRVSLRQGVLVAILVSGLIFLEAQNFLHWWVGLTLALFLIAIESFFLAN